MVHKWRSPPFAPTLKDTSMKFELVWEGAAVLETEVQSLHARKDRCTDRYAKVPTFSIIPLEKFLWNSRRQKGLFPCYHLAFLMVLHDYPALFYFFLGGGVGGWWMLQFCEFCIYPYTSWILLHTEKLTCPPTSCSGVHRICVRPLHIWIIPATIISPIPPRIHTIVDVDGWNLKKIQHIPT